jgi:hypothetical protein
LADSRAAVAADVVSHLADAGPLWLEEGRQQRAGMLVFACPMMSSARFCAAISNTIRFSAADFPTLLTLNFSTKLATRMMTFAAMRGR